MNLGILARAERNRGIGVQTREYAAHLDPAKVLVVDVGEHEQYPIHPEDFERATVVEMAADGTLPERLVRKWMLGLDAVLIVETPMDWRLCKWARDQGVRTIVHVNPEFYRHGLHRLPHPDGWWAPTTWRLDELPAGTVHVPVPVALERFRRQRESTRTRVRFLHPVGKWAMYDRNGTETFVRACHLASRGEPLDATITCLHPLPHECAPGGEWVDVRVGGVANYWEAYDGFDVVVLPRRYGGLSLSTQEAMAAGLAVVMPDVSPNTECWPVVPVPARLTGRVPMPAGQVPLAEVRPEQLLEVMRRLAGSPRDLRAAKEQSIAWAEEHSWEKMVPRYMTEIQRVITDPLPPPETRVTHDPFAAAPPRVRSRQPPQPPPEPRPRRERPTVPPPEPSERRPRQRN